MAEKEKFDINSLVDKDITELSAKDARNGLDQLLLRSSGTAAEAGIRHELVGDDLVGDFALMISDKVGGGNEKLESAAYMLTTFVILETVQKVFFDVGSSVALLGSTVGKIDMTALTLHQIKKSVQQIDKKVSKLLKAPLLNAIDHFNEVTDYFMSHKYEDAYNMVNEVKKCATNAFNLIAENNIDIKTFADCVKAVQLLIFSKIIQESYDKKKQIFLPYAKLSKATRDVISRFVERNVDKCISLKENVKLPMLTFEKEKKKSTIQDMLDSILQLAYPYVSEGNGWTNLDHKITDDNYISFKMNPKYLPMGIEDRTEVIIGKWGSEVARFSMWRDGNKCYARFGVFNMVENMVEVKCDSERKEPIDCTMPLCFDDLKD